MIHEAAILRVVRYAVLKTLAFRCMSYMMIEEVWMIITLKICLAHSYMPLPSAYDNAYDTSLKRQAIPPPESNSPSRILIFIIFIIFVIITKSH